MEDQTPVIVIEQKDEKRRRGGLVWLLALAFVAVLAVGGTFAFLTYTTNQASNRVTTDPNITADVIEPAWSSAANADGNTAKAPDSTKIPAAANNMLPGDSVAKNPSVVNTSKSGADEYVGIQLQFEVWNGSAYEAMTAQQVADTLAIYGLSKTQTTTTPGITELGDNWVQITDAAYGATATATVGDAAGTKATFFVGKDDADGQKGCMYFYNTAVIKAMTAADDESYGENVATANKSSELFSYIRFLDAATQAQLDQFNKTVLKSKSAGGTVETPSWRVNVKGAAIQVTYNGTTTATKGAADFVSATDGVQWLTLLNAAAVDSATGWRTGGYVPTKTTEQ